MIKTIGPYRDFWLRLSVSVLLAFFFVFLGTDSLAGVAAGKYFIYDLIAGFSLSFIITTWINLVTSYLDNQYPWTGFFATRLVYQFVAGVVITSVFVLAFMYTYLQLLLGFKKEEVQFFNTEFPISVLFIIFWNVLYAGLYFYKESKKSRAMVLLLEHQLYTIQNIKTGSAVLPAPSVTPGQKTIIDEDIRGTGNGFSKIKILVAVSGNKNIPIPVEEIAYFFKDGNYTTLKTFQSETYLLNHSLDELIKLLEEDSFFRANRQFIINLKACRFFTNEENGKLSLHLNPEHQEEVIISQKRAPAFKDWLNK